MPDSPDRWAEFLSRGAMAAAGDLGAGTTIGLKAGIRIGPYEVESMLGAGGMGEVYRARDTTLHRHVALKVLSAANAVDEARVRLIREARNAAALNHPNICTIYEVGEVGDRAFIAMEYADGVSLSARLRSGPLPLQDALRYGRDAADALAYAHEHGVIHRDFKAANVMLTSDGRLKIVDFGLARRGDALMGDATTMPTLVPAGAAAGTPYAMAPEQVRGEVADARTDIWALGVLLYEMASGVEPFAGATISEMFSAILRDAPKPLPASVPAALAAIVDRCLAKDPSARFQSAADARAALDAAQGDLAPRRARRIPTMSRRASWTAAAAAALAVVALLGYEFRTRLTVSIAGPAPIRLAVLPFDNLSGDQGQDYFSDGLTEELIAQLGGLEPGRLSVISRSSSMRYRKNQTPLAQIARDLNVDYVLEGSARREGTRVRVTAALVRLDDQAERWSQTFDRELASVLTVQSDIARGVASSLALTLLPGEQTRLAAARPIDPDAFDAYLKGLAHAEKLTREDLDVAEQYYTQALAKQPDYALAYVGLSEVWSGRQQMQFVPPRIASPQLRQAAQRAIELDPTLPEAHYRLAIQYSWTDWDWPAAEREFQRTIDLGPSLAEARAGYAHFLYMMKRPAEGAQQIQRAIDLDPFNEQVRAFYATTLHFEHRFADEEPELRKVLATDPRSPMATNGLSEVFHLTGRYDESFAAERARWAARDDVEMEDALTRGYAQGGYRAAMRLAADTLAAKTEPLGALTVPVARLYLRAGMHDRALDWLENAYRAHDPNMPYIGVAPAWDELRSEPRFQDLMARMKLPI